MKVKKILFLICILFLIVSCSNININTNTETTTIKSNTKSTPTSNQTSKTKTTTSKTSKSTTEIPKELKVNVNELKILENKKGQLVGETNYQNSGIEYKVTKGTDIISIDNNGIVTGLKKGNAEVTVSVKDNLAPSKVIPVTVISQNENADLAFKSCDSNFNYSDLLSYNAPSIGKQKILVIPFTLSNDKTEATNENLEIIKKAYTGTKEEVGWMSVKDYFYNASYGKLEYDALVTDYFVLPEEFIEVGYSNMDEIAPLALEWYQKNSDIDLSSFDKNNDGFIDNIHIISCNRTNTAAGNSGPTFDEINKVGYKVKKYAIINLYAIKDTKGTGGVPTGGINSKVIIHENGHMLGLLDYYDYKNQVSLTGMFDMQDCDIMDWNIFSKFAVGWVNPKYIDDSYIKEHKSISITLASSALDGDCLVIKNNSLLGIPFDEYLIIELFNPDAKNNYYDSHYADGSIYIKEARNIGFGVKIYHVDARMLQYYWDNDKNDVAIEYVTKDTIDKIVDERIVFHHNASYGEEDLVRDEYKHIGNDALYYKLVHLLQKGNKNTFGYKSNDYSKVRKYQITDDFWQTGDTFSIGSHENYTDYGKKFFYYKDKFNDGTILPYGIVFDEVTPNTVTLTINYFE